MRTTREGGRLVLAGALLGALACSGMEQMESGFQQRLVDLDTCAARVEPTKRAEVMAAKATYQAEYARLPVDAAQREPLLASLNQRSLATIQACEAVAAASALQQTAAMRQALVGNWQGGSMVLRIDPNGTVAYQRSDGGGNRSVTAPMTTVTPSSFEVGLMGLTTTFRIDRPPHEEGGAWKMTVDGVELTRMPSGPGATPTGGMPLAQMCTAPVDGACPTAMMTFPPLTPVIHGSTVLPWVPRPGGQVRIQWIAENVAPVEAPNAVIATSDLAVEPPAVANANNYTISYHMTAPPTGRWYPGTYRVEVSVDGQSVSTVRFQVPAR